MERVVKGILLALGMAMGLLAVACSSNAADSSVAGDIGRSSAQQVTPGPRMMTPGPAVGATPTGTPRRGRATPTMVGTPGPARIQATLRDMDQLRDRLRNLAGGTPTGSDLVNSAQSATVLVGELHMEISQMTPEEHDQALTRLNEVLAQLGQVVDTYGRQVRPTGTPGAMTPTPGGMDPRATPTMMRGTPGPATAQELMTRIDQLRDQLMRMASGQPTAESIAIAVDSMRTTVTDVHQRLGTLSTQDLEALTGNLADAMDDLTLAIETYVRQSGMAPAATPSPTMRTP